MICPHCGSHIAPSHTKVRAHVLSYDDYLIWIHGGSSGLKVKQAVRDMYKGQNLAGVDVYSPDEELLFRVSY